MKNGMNSVWSYDNCLCGECKSIPRPLWSGCSLFREALATRKPTIYNTEDCKRDYIYIYDLMQYLYRMAMSEKHYEAEIFNLAT